MVTKKLNHIESTCIFIYDSETLPAHHTHTHTVDIYKILSDVLVRSNITLIKEINVD